MDTASSSCPSFSQRCMRVTKPSRNAISGTSVGVGCCCGCCGCCSCFCCSFMASSAASFNIRVVLIFGGDSPSSGGGGALGSESMLLERALNPEEIPPKIFSPACAAADGGGGAAFGPNGFVSVGGPNGFETCDGGGIALGVERSGQRGAGRRGVDTPQWRKPHSASPCENGVMYGPRGCPVCVPAPPVSLYRVSDATAFSDIAAASPKSADVARVPGCANERLVVGW